MLIRYYGSCGLRSGYAHAANEMCLALLAAGAHLEIRQTGPEPGTFEGPLLPLAACLCTEETATPNPDVVIFHSLPSDCGKQLGGFESSGRMAKFRVAYTTWDASSQMPQAFFDKALSRFDQVWVPSSNVWRHIPTPKCFVIPHCFDPAQLPMRQKERETVPKRFSFYYLGDYHGRKNPAGIVQAWARAFTADDPVELHLYSCSANLLTMHLWAHMTGLGAEEMAPIRFHNETLTDAEVIDVHRQHDCYVTASRGEAWNLPAFEAMLAGRMIITTKGLGSDEYLGHTTALFVDARRAPCLNDIDIAEAPEGADPGVMHLKYMGIDGATARQDWLDPDINDLAMAMREVFGKRRRTIVPKYDPATKFSRQAVGQLAMTALSKGMLL